MSVFHVDSQQVALAATTADRSAASIRAEVAQMMSFLQGLEASWSGAAAQSFQSVLEQWRATQAQVDESLSLISAHLQQASHTYAEAEQSATSLFG